MKEGQEHLFETPTKSKHKDDKKMKNLMEEIDGNDSDFMTRKRDKNPLRDEKKDERDRKKDKMDKYSSIKRKRNSSSSRKSTSPSATNDHVSPSSSETEKDT